MCKGSFMDGYMISGNLWKDSPLSAWGMTAVESSHLCVQFRPPIGAPPTGASLHRLEKLCSKNKKMGLWDCRFRMPIV